MTTETRPHPGPLWRAIAVALAAPIVLLAWDTANALMIARHARFLLDDELPLYLVIKAGFVVVLILFVTARRAWRRLGFCGGPGRRFWVLMLPAWLSAALSLVQGPVDIPSSRAIGWLGLGILIALGEETIFRGIVLNAFAGRGPRIAIVSSAILFGLIHLVGLGGGVDIRMVVAQMVFASGLGISFAWVRLASGSIWPSVIAHAVMDGIGLAAADGVGNALRYESDSYPAALASAAASLAWGLFLLSRPPPAGLSRGAAAVGPAAPAAPGADRGG